MASASLARVIVLQYGSTRRLEVAITPRVGGDKALQGGSERLVAVGSAHRHDVFLRIGCSTRGRMRYELRRRALASLQRLGGPSF